MKKDKENKSQSKRESKSKKQQTMKENKDFADEDKAATEEFGIVEQDFPPNENIIEDIPKTEYIGSEPIELDTREYIQSENLIQYAYDKAPHSPEEVKTIREASTYSIPVFDIIETGLRSIGTITLQFVKGNKANPEDFRQPGIVTESVLIMLIQYLKENNINDLKNEHTTNAIIHLETALYKINQRAADRKNRGVQGTYQK